MLTHVLAYHLRPGCAEATHAVMRKGSLTGRGLMGKGEAAEVKTHRSHSDVGMPFPAPPSFLHSTTHPYIGHLRIPYTRAAVTATRQLIGREIGTSCHKHSSQPLGQVPRGSAHHPQFWGGAERGGGAFSGVYSARHRSGADTCFPLGEGRSRLDNSDVELHGSSALMCGYLL